MITPPWLGGPAFGLGCSQREARSGGEEEPADHRERQEQEAAQGD